MLQQSLSQNTLSSRIANQFRIQNGTVSQMTLQNRASLDIASRLQSSLHSQTPQSPRFVSAVSKQDQMRTINTELQEYRKMKQQVITQTLSQQNEPIRERFNIDLNPPILLDWEVKRKERIIKGRKELSLKFKEQKQAISSYLEGNEVENRIIKTHKEVVQPSPIQRAHSAAAKKPEESLYSVHPVAQSKTQTIQNSSKFFLRSQKQFFQKDQPTGAAAQIAFSNGAHPLQKPPKSAIVQMVCPEFLKYGKKRKPDDPIKLRMKEYLEKFLKGEQQYFQILENTKTQGSSLFQSSIQLNQKFYYDQIRESDVQFNQVSDLKTSKRYRIIQTPRITSNKIEETPQQSKKRIGSAKDTSNVSGYRNLSSRMMEEDQMTLEVGEGSYQDQTIESMDAHYGKLLNGQRESLEDLLLKLKQSKQGFERNTNQPKEYSDFLRLVKCGDLHSMKIAIEVCPSLINEATDHLGQTALHWAAKRGYKQLTQELITAGADLCAKDANGKTPLNLAEQQQQIKTASLIKKEQAFKKVEKNLLQKAQTIVTSQFE